MPCLVLLKTENLEAICCHFEHIISSLNQQKSHPLLAWIEGRKYMFSPNASHEPYLYCPIAEFFPSFSVLDNHIGQHKTNRDSSIEKDFGHFAEKLSRTTIPPCHNLYCPTAVWTAPFFLSRERLIAATSKKESAAENHSFTLPLAHLQFLSKKQLPTEISKPNFPVMRN
jgi:hypothetical protein